MSDNENHVKIVFPLTKDDDGYPPDDIESVWAFREADGSYRIDNVPFFIRGVSSGDVVVAEPEGDVLVFSRIVREGGHSTVRVLIADENDTQRVRDELRHLGCPSELSYIPGLIAVDIPPAVPLGEVRRFLSDGEAAGRWEYEEGCIAHAS